METCYFGFIKSAERLVSTAMILTFLLISSDFIVCEFLTKRYDDCSIENSVWKVSLLWLITYLVTLQMLSGAFFVSLEILIVVALAFLGKVQETYYTI